MKDSVKLIIHINAYGLESQEIDFIYLEDSIEKIDNLTLKYLNDELFFLKNKESILLKIKMAKNKYGFSISPVDIELGAQKIYILKGNRKIRTLFQEITFRNQIVALEDLIKNNLKIGGLRNLIKCDQYFMSKDEYVSLFANCNKRIIYSLTFDLITNGLIEELYDYFKIQKYFSKLIRFLFIKEQDFSIILEKFLNINNISNYRENNHIIKYEKILLPYKDD